MASTYQILAIQHKLNPSEVVLMYCCYSKGGREKGEVMELEYFWFVWLFKTDHLELKLN